VALALVATREPATTHVAGERLFAGVSTQVRRQVVGPAERPGAHLALERLLPRVNPHVARQLVAARKSAFTARDGADVRPLGGRPSADRQRLVSTARSSDGR